MSSDFYLQGFFKCGAKLGQATKIKKTAKNF